MKTKKASKYRIKQKTKRNRRGGKGEKLQICEKFDKKLKNETLVLGNCGTELYDIAGSNEDKKSYLPNVVLINKDEDILGWLEDTGAIIYTDNNGNPYQIGFANKTDYKDFKYYYDDDNNLTNIDDDDVPDLIYPITLTLYDSDVLSVPKNSNIKIKKLIELEREKEKEQMRNKYNQKKKPLLSHNVSDMVLKFSGYNLPSRTPATSRTSIRPATSIASRTSRTSRRPNTRISPNTNRDRIYKQIALNKMRAAASSKK